MEAASVTALWRLVWDSAKSNPATFLALISAITALTATLVAPLVSLRIASRQIRATHVSANRQAWINTLRDDLSELFELLMSLYLLPSETHTGEEDFKYVSQRRSRIRFLRNRIRLRLNPVEKPSKTLLELIDTLHIVADDVIETDIKEEFTDVMESAVSTSQEILKAEWKRVKKGH